MKTIAIKELKERINLNMFDCSQLFCSRDCIFNTNSVTCKGHRSMFDFDAIKKHDFGKLKRTGVFGLLMFATDNNNMRGFDK